MTTSNIRYAFYSATADECGVPLNVYRLTDGREVTVTHIATDREASGYGYTDSVYLGETVSIDGWVRNVRCDETGIIGMRK